ncbi:hypothetical protein P3G55_10970 [Leptospira sp. 96542]|nr:hypothetical protein [Leptospira sp. 96542]
MDKNKYKPGLLENWGRRVLISLHIQLGNKKKQTLSFSKQSNSLVFWGVFWSFWIGFLPSLLFVYLLKFLPETPFEELNITYIIQFVLILVFVTLLEFYFLFRLGFYLAYRMGESANIELADEPELITPIPGMFARLVLEIPDPRIQMYGIDPYKHLNKRALFFRTLLYKSKVFLSNIVGKFILKSILGRTSIRFLVDYISAPITGIWDSITTYLILKELQKRIITRKISDSILNYLKSLQLDVKTKEVVIRTIAISIVYTKTFHPNFEYLLFHMLADLKNSGYLNELDDWENWETNLRNLDQNSQTLVIRLFIIFVCYDGKTNSEETLSLKRLASIFDTNFHKDIETLSSLIRGGKLMDSIHFVESFLALEKMKMNKQSV